MAEQDIPNPKSIIPTVAEVDRIAGLQDPVTRNLQITQCYSELSQALTARTGFSANWCTFATWASKQAGQSIRKEDLRRILERILQETHETRQPAEEVALQAQQIGVKRSSDEIRALAPQAVDIRLAVDRASEAVARGNKKVFEEIGGEFARFCPEFLQDVEPDADKLELFCSGLRPGEPPEGQRYLSQAFRRYYHAFFEEDAKTRAELLLCANIEIGLHEQTRLQPEIAAALDAAFFNTTQFTRFMLAASLPVSGWLASSMWLARRLLGRPSALEMAIQALQSAVQIEMRRALTETMMTLHLPPDVLVRLGDDLTASFPEILSHLNNPDLCALLARLDPTPDSTIASGALDWANLPERLHFIVDLFRCYQETRDLFDSPFSPQQVAELKAGRLPGGTL
jgi:hypothetical protein